MKTDPSKRVTPFRTAQGLALALAALLCDRAGPAALGIVSGWGAGERLSRRAIERLVRLLQLFIGGPASLLLESAKLARLRRIRVSLPSGESPVSIISRVVGTVLELHAVPSLLTGGLDIECVPEEELYAALCCGDIARVMLILHGEEVEWPVLLLGRHYELSALSRRLAIDPERVATIIVGKPKPAQPRPETAKPSVSADYGTDYFFAVMTLAAKLPSLVPVLHDADARRRKRLAKPPFDRGEYRASWTAPSAAPKTRSVLFLHHNYYSNLFLAAALRRRGWDALSVSVEAPNSLNSWLYHGEDLSLYDPDPEVYQRRLFEFYQTIPERFRLVHYHGYGTMGLFPQNCDGSDEPRDLPWDYLELRRRGVKIAFIPSGCMDGVSQTAIRDFAGVCRRCNWELRPDVCSDKRNLVLARKLDLVCDMLCPETGYPLEALGGPKSFCEPLVSTVDPDLWHPNIEIPPELRIPHAEDELIVYHAFGNYAIRRVGDRDEKGSGAVMAAIERLQKEGMKVQLKFLTDTPSRLVRFYQVQADVVVDQLNYGRYGANAREAMMLGKPTICYMNLRQPAPQPPSRALAECPLVSATEKTVYEVLKGLLLDADRRRRLGQACRAFAIKWHSPDACAARYERVYDRLMAGLPPQADEVFAEEDATPLTQVAA
jgi:glycosyltransferase involved in cell wall biosynthesis